MATWLLSIGYRMDEEDQARPFTLEPQLLGVYTTVTSVSITVQNGCTPFRYALASDTKTVIDVFLSEDIEDASVGLLHDAISVYKDNSIAKELISRKYKHLDENDKVLSLTS